MRKTTEDINHRQWLNVIRRLQSVAKSRGWSRLTISVWVNAHGFPLFWSEPKVARLEPAGSEGLDRFMSLIGRVLEISPAALRTEMQKFVDLLIDERGG